MKGNDDVCTKSLAAVDFGNNFGLQHHFHVSSQCPYLQVKSHEASMLSRVSSRPVFPEAYCYLCRDDMMAAGLVVVLPEEAASHEILALYVDAVPRSPDVVDISACMHESSAW